eukprot:PhM_4_TR219/c0_g1_i1/m.43287
MATSLDYDALLQATQEAATAAGCLMLECKDKARTRETTFETKANVNDLVTQYDRACEDVVRAVLLKATPTYSIVGEETYSGAVDDDTVESAGPVWVVDPIDGTTSFVHNSFDCCVSIGLCVDGEPVLGVVHNPNMKETFTAVRGQGAFLNGEPIHVSGHNSVSGALLAVHYSTDRSDASIETTQRLMKTLLQTPCHALRTMGSAAMDMCGVACGRLDGYLERPISSWDICAGAVIVREAGGLVAALDGGALSLRKDKCSVLCSSSAALHSELVYVAKGCDYTI